MNDKYLAQLLSDNEKIILVTRRHWLFLLGQIAPELALILLVLVAVSATWITWTAAAAFGYLLLISAAGQPGAGFAHLGKPQACGDLAPGHPYVRGLEQKRDRLISGESQ